MDVLNDVFIKLKRDSERYTRNGLVNQDYISGNIAGKMILFKLFKEDLGLFFWERGGVEHLRYCVIWFVPPVRHYDYNLIFDVCLEKADNNVKSDIVNRDMQDFLDCLACLGEDKVKELIEKDKGVRE